MNIKIALLAAGFLKPSRRIATFAAGAICAAPALRVVAEAEDWPGYRGPTGMGVTAEKGLPLEWGGAENKNVLWQTPLPPTLHQGEADHNQSSPVVAAGKVIVTTAHWPATPDFEKGQRFDRRFDRRH